MIPFSQSHRIHSKKPVCVVSLSPLGNKLDNFDTFTVDLLLLESCQGNLDCELVLSTRQHGKANSTNLGIVCVCV